MINFKSIVGFDWDAGNIDKIQNRHNVDKLEVEQAFFNGALFEYDMEHSQKETRVKAWGVTDKTRYLMIVITIRKNKIRPISARDMSKKERRKYHDKIKESTRV